MRYSLLALTSLIFISTAAFAEDPAAGGATDPAAGTTSTSAAGGTTGGGASSGGELSRKDAVNALNFYTGELEFQRQKREDHFRLEDAPGTAATIGHGVGLAKAALVRNGELKSMMADEVARTITDSAASTPSLMLSARKLFSLTNDDLKTSTLLGTSKIAIKDLAATENHIKLVTNGIPIGIDPDKIQGPAAIDALANSIVQAAALSTGYHSMAEMLAKRKPGSDDKSEMQLMEEECTWRFFDPNNNWYAEIAVTSNEGLLREIAHMQAVHLYMEFERYKQMERIESMLAAQLGNSSIMIQALGKIAAAGPGGGGAGSNQNITEEQARDVEKKMEKYKVN